MHFGGIFYMIILKKNNKMYNYLFYSAYRMALKTSKWNDTPIFYSSGAVMICSVFNLMTVLVLVEPFLKGFHLTQLTGKLVTVKYLVGALLCAVVYFYYAYNGRGDKIYLKYSQRNKSDKIHPMLVMLLYFTVSFLLFMISTMFMRKDGFFSR